ncbi:enoyl-CoA hydratase-related protein [Streptomyces chartreusis]
MTDPDTVTDSAVRLSTDDGILVVTLDRPKANAVDVATSRALYAAFERLRTDPGLRVGIVTGAGERFFCAGWDLKAAAAGEAVDADHGPGGFAGLTEFFTLDKPVIAAVNGLALGGGFELALAADLIVAAEHAEFALTEVTLGLVPDSGGVLRLPRRLPAAIAAEMLLTGCRMAAPEAARWGLVNQVVPGDTLLASALTLARRISRGAPLAVSAIKEITRMTEGHRVEDAFATMRGSGTPIYRAVLNSKDAEEGARAFAEKRPPVWTGL